MKNTTKPTGCVTIYQRSFCALTMSVMLNDPVNITTPMSDNPMNTSYAIICDAPLSAPSKEYLLLDAHPPSTILYTASDDIARKKSKPMLRSATTMFGANGMITKLISTDPATIAGAV